MSPPLTPGKSSSASLRRTRDIPNEDRTPKKRRLQPRNPSVLEYDGFESLRESFLFSLSPAALALMRTAREAPKRADIGMSQERRISEPDTSPPRGLPTLVNTSGIDRPLSNRALAAGEVVSNQQNWQRFVQIQANGIKGECAVCLADLSEPHALAPSPRKIGVAEQEATATLPCFHRFHLTCAQRCLSLSLRCPSCREDIEELAKSGEKEWRESRSILPSCKRVKPRELMELRDEDGVVNLLSD